MDINTPVFEPVLSIATMEAEIEEIYARLRSIRRSKNLTLADVEKLSKGAFRAISIGSYERGDRELSVKKAIQIAAFYELPLAYLLTGKSNEQVLKRKIVVDIRRLKSLEEQRQNSLTMQIFISFMSGIIKARQDFNGEVISLRENDCEYLTISIGCTHDELLQFLDVNNLILKTK